MSGKAHGGNWQCAADQNNRANCLGYDAAGNVVANGTAHYSFDAENRLASAGGMTYTYDADGNRVEKSSGSTGTLYWYGSPGIIAESDLSGNIQHEYVFFNGKRVARIDQPGSSVHYYLSDHLGSTSMVVSSLGAIEEESDYSPFGSQYLVSGSAANHYKFTGKERDNETGLDLMGARYYGSALGRFITTDPLYIEMHRLADPQSLNLYAYARNNPITLSDPTGLDVSFKCDTAANCNQAVKDFNGRKGAQFKVQLGKNNKLNVVKGSVAKNLSKSEKALLGAVNNKDYHATVNISGNTGQSEFGVHNSAGVNSVDLGNLSKLDAPSNAGGLNSGDALAHDALDSYYSLFLDDPDEADSAAAQFYPGLYPPTQNHNTFGSGGTTLTGATQYQGITDGRGGERVGFRYITPVPAIDLFGKSGAQANQITHDAGSRVTGVTYEPK